MDNNFWVNRGGRAFDPDVYRALDKFAAKRGGGHVIDCAYFSGQEGARWTDFPVAIYYVGERPSGSRFKNRYFGLNFHRLAGSVTIFDADRIEEIRFAGRLVEASGEFVFSRWRHDFRGAKTANFSVDGGLDYIRIVGDIGGSRHAAVAIRDGNFVEIT